MQRIMCKSKIHRAKITQADLNYVGSLGIDKDIMEAANIIPYEKVEIWNISNGNRLTTYAIEHKRGSKEITANGAAARLLHPGDLVIIACFALIDEKELKDFKPKVVFVDKNNNITQVVNEEQN